MKGQYCTNADFGPHISTRRHTMFRRIMIDAARATPPTIVMTSQTVLKESSRSSSSTLRSDMLPSSSSVLMEDTTS